MISKNSKKRIKTVLMQFGLWNFVKAIKGSDKGNPLNKNFEEVGLAFYKAFVQPNDLVFDVGANYGNRVALFLSLEAKVVAIEPQQKCVTYLKNKFKNIEIEAVGLGAKRELKTFYEADHSVLSTFSDSYIEKVKDTRHKTSIWTKKEEIQIVTLDELILKHGQPSFIKIDVEGYEYAVLEGLSQKTGTISFEYNVPEMTDTVIKCLDKLQNLGYKSFNYSIGESMVFTNDWLNYTDFLRLIEREIFLKSSFGDIYVS
jgi:FkbM family methyltransferase